MKRHEDPTPAMFKLLCNALEKAGIAKAQAEYSGAGDEGAVEELRFFDRDNNAIPIEVARAISLTNHQGISVPLTMCLEQAVAEVLPGGWGDDAGAYGLLEIDVLARKWAVDHTQRSEESEVWGDTIKR
jgi:hypothetical protein